MKNILTRFCKIIVSCGISRQIPFGGFLCSLIAFPLLMIFSWLYNAWPSAFWWISGGLIIIVSIATYGALQDSNQEDYSFTLDKILGLMLVFFQIPLSPKRMLVGFLGFHLLRAVMPFAASRLFEVDTYKVLGALSVVIFSLFSGAVMNMFLWFVLWIAY